MPVLSILLPCCNALDTIEEALVSVEGQSFKDFEVIMVDDGSTDGTRQQLERWHQKDSRFRLIVQPHSGIISALNRGLEMCTAPVIARMDADDRAAPERFERQLQALNRDPDVALVSCLVEGFPKENVREGFQIYLDWLNHLITHDDICREIFIESPFPHPSVMVRRSWLDKVGGYQEHGWPEDYDLWLRMYVAGAKFAKIPEALLDWREHPERLTRTDSRYSLENFIRCKAHYLAKGPLKDRDAVIIWGAGMMGRRISKHLQREGAPLAAFVDIDPKKIGNTRRGKPIIAPDELPGWWKRYDNPIILAAVGARGARRLIRERLNNIGYKEGQDWLGAA